MSFRVPDDDDDDNLPSTPDYKSHASGAFKFGNLPSTTPAGPAPSEHASSTPAGAPTASFMGSSLMKAVGASATQKSNPQRSNPFALSGLDGNTPPVKNPFATAGSTSKGTNPFSSKPPKNLFAPKPKSNTTIGRSTRSGQARQPSRLREEVVDDEVEDEDQRAPLRQATGSFQVDYSDEEDDEEEEQEYEDEGDEAARPTKNHSAKAFMEDFGEYSGDEEDEDAEGDLWLDVDRNDEYENYELGDASDLMMLNTPAADERVFKEAEGIFRATANRSGVRRQSFRFATYAKDIFSQAEYATITEPPELILDTEKLIERLYKDGVGAEEDDERLDDTLAAVTGQLTGLWKQYVDALPLQSEEHAAEIGPSPQATPFEKATFLATLALQIHHTRTGDDGKMTEPLPETLFRWLSENHNPYPNQVQEVLRCKPCPASHSMFWPTVCMALLRGQVSAAQSLLMNAAWEKIKTNRRGELEYTGRALENVRRAAEETCAMLDDCPAKKGNWQIWNSDWTIFRIKARAKLEQLRRFAEGKSAVEFDIDSAESHQSLSAAARKAESQVPWDIYENLNVLFEIVLGAPDVIFETAQDWCEATIGLFGWWDETRGDKNSIPTSQSLVLASQSNGADGYMERLARSLRAAIGSGFHFNVLNAVEVGMASIFEDNAKGLIALLRIWSLPVAAAVTEIASLGRWLPQHQPSALYAFDDLDMEDLEVLGVNPQDPDEADGIKDNTLIQYAQELANYNMSSLKERYSTKTDGWEIAIHVLGRMDSPQRSEDTVGELVETILQEINVESGEMVDKVWRLLNDLGMIQFAEQVAEVSFL